MKNNRQSSFSRNPKSASGPRQTNNLAQRSSRIEQLECRQMLTAAAALDTSQVSAPTVNGSGNSDFYQIGGAAVTLDSGITVSSTDTNLTGATLSFTSGTFQPGDGLGFTNQNGISGVYQNGVLTLTGSATVADYQQALRSITFSTSSTSTDGRFISVVVSDGSLSGDPIIEVVDVMPAVGTPPVSPTPPQSGLPLVNGSGNSDFYQIGGAPVTLDSGITVSSTATNLTGATLSFTSGTFQPGDGLSFTNQNGISGVYQNGVLTLTGSATVAQYQQALRSVTFSTSSTSTDGRFISVVVSDGSLSSDPIIEVVDVMPVAATPPYGGTPSDPLQPLLPIGGPAQVPFQAPAAPVAGFVPLALGVQETPASSTVITPGGARSNFVPFAPPISSPSTHTASTTGTGSTGTHSSTTTTSTTSGRSSANHHVAATDAALADFDPTDLSGLGFEALRPDA